MTTLAHRLKSLREQKHMSISDLAMHIGVSATTYREWELGRAIKGEKVYPKMAAALGTSLEYLMTGKSNPTDGLLHKLDEIERITREIKSQLCQSSVEDEKRNRP